MYLGNVEHVIADNGSSTYKRYLANGTVLITQDHDRFDTRTAQATHYLVKDHVGSLTGILDQYGAIDQSFSYDAWGQRRNPTTAAMLDLLTLRSTLHSRTTPRGFTGHEMLDAVGIIHMNGRIYDPKLGRFLQADPVIQFPDYSQSWNSYSYVLNNPLTHTDPSGYFIGKFFKKVFKGLNKLLGDFAPFVGIALLAFPPVYGWVMQSWMHAFAFGFATGGIATGSLRGALFGGISAAAFYGIGKHFEALTGLPEGGLGHIATHGLAGGILAELQGGQFGHGFLAAGLSKAVMGRFSYEDGSAPAVLGRTTIAAVVGGTISRITGGKFANGALTSAMAQLFNAERAAREAQRTRVRPHDGEIVKNPDGRFSPEGHFRRNADGTPRPHYGVDYAGKVGDQIVAAGDGMVKLVCPASRCVSSGNQISILHDDGTYSRYFHLETLSVNQGATVSAGQTIGTLGITGNAVNTPQPHLHFEVRQGGITGAPLDPEIWLGQ